MNICLLISGHLRTFRECLPSIKRFLIDELDCDVFMHSWKEVESNTASWHNSHMINRKVNNSDLLFIKDVLSPKEIVLEDQHDFGLSDNLHNSKMSLNGLKNMTLGFKRVYDLMKNYETKTRKKYDLIIKIRPDIMLNKPLRRNLLNMKSDFILFFGNPVPITNYDGVKKYYHNFRALDIISICTNDDASYGVYGLYENFEKYYKKKTWHHSPYLDFVIDRNIPFNISLRYLYNSAWFIKRAANE
jgi:hypothetical protein